jgi:voltage-gated potassium channel
MANGAVMSSEPPKTHVAEERRRRQLVWGLVRAFVSAVLMVALYYVLPLDDRSGAYVVGGLVLALGVLGGVMVWQLRAVVRSRLPALRAIQALATATAAFLVLFAASYFILAENDATAFSEPLTRSDALYFTVTIFATVGFGDISAKAEFARLMVTGQMLLDLLIVGLGLQVLVEAVRRSRGSSVRETR